MLIINIRNVLTRNEQPHFVQQWDVAHLFAGRKDVEEVGVLDVELQARATKEDAFEVNGSLRLELKMACSRCLTFSPHQMTIPFHEVFVQSDDELDEADDFVHAVTADKLDLTPYVEESIVLALPYVPLCSENCRGLCQVCGTNRNEINCECKVDIIDPRLAALADLLKEQ